MKKLVSLLVLFSLFMLSACNLNDAEETIDHSESESESTLQSSESHSDSESGSDSEEKEEVPIWGEDGFLKILTIGNSFSDDTMEYVYQIAKSAGVSKIKLGNLYIGGCTLNTHADNASADKAAYEYRTNVNGTWTTQKNYKMSDAISSENWDFISLQQASGSSGKPETYSKLDYMISYVKKKASPNTQLVWNMTWAYQQNNNHDEFYKYNNDQMVMYEKILDTVESVVKTKKSIKMISPTGTAIQNARTSYLGDTLTRDGFHLSLSIGRYIAGLTFFHKLTGISIDGLQYRPVGINANYQKIAIEAAINAVQTPNDITFSEYEQEEEIDLSKYTKLDLGWTPLAYWNSSVGKGLDTKSSNHIQFCATRLISKEELPEGSIIMLSNGWKYRPEAWPKASTRPGEVDVCRYVVDDLWWASYTERGFNLSKVNNPSLEGITLEELNNAFVIYVPKN